MRGQNSELGHDPGSDSAATPGTPPPSFGGAGRVSDDLSADAESRPWGGPQADGGPSDGGASDGTWSEGTWVNDETAGLPPHPSDKPVWPPPRDQNAFEAGGGRGLDDTQPVMLPGYVGAERHEAEQAWYTPPAGEEPAPPAIPYTATPPPIPASPPEPVAPLNSPPPSAPPGPPPAQPGPPSEQPGPPPPYPPLPQASVAPGARPRRRKTLLLVGGVFVAGVLATAAVFGYQAFDARAMAPRQPAPAENAPGADPAPVAVNSEETDQRPLEADEAFPSGETTVGPRTFTRVKRRLDEDCTKATAGPFAESLEREKCRRVIRATYVDAEREYAVTAGIAVLPTREAALRVDKTKDLARNLWFRPLPGSRKSGTARMHQAGGYAAGLVWGRYIIFAYATHVGGRTPDPTEKELASVSGAFRDYAATPIEKRVTE